MLPAELAQALTAILAGLDRRAPVLVKVLVKVLVNQGALQERTLVAGEPHGVPLPWPAGCGW